MLEKGCPQALANIWRVAEAKDEFGVGVESPLEDYIRRITPTSGDWEKQDELDFESAAEDDRMLWEFLDSKMRKELELGALKEREEEKEKLMRAAAARELAVKEESVLARCPMPRSTGSVHSDGTGHVGWKGVIDFEGNANTSIGLVVQLGAVIIWDPAAPRQRRMEIKFQLPVKGMSMKVAGECRWVSKISGVRWGGILSRLHSHATRRIGCIAEERVGWCGSLLEGN